MIITFVHHSCFVVETDEREMIFDYFKKGNMQEVYKRQGWVSKNISQKTICRV